jgi:L-2-hydroxyglutarate oxidase LhgO
MGHQGDSSMHFLKCVQAGAEMACNVKVVQVDLQGQGLVVHAEDMHSHDVVTVLCKAVVNCAGLHAHRLLQNIKGFPAEHVPRVWFAKGNYFTVSGRSPFSRLVYPMPDDGGLGTHLTLDLAGVL